jgi:uncharacterized protein (TIGR02996 family)
MPPRRSPTPVLFTPEVVPFVRAIKADLDDDAPRLILADWLGERGEGERLNSSSRSCRLKRA